MQDAPKEVKPDDSEDQNVAVTLFLRRLERAMKARGVKRGHLARDLGMGAPSVSEWWTVGRVPMGDALLRLPELLRVNGHWLLTGDGDMEAPAKPGEAERAIGEIAELVDRYRGATAPDAGAQRMTKGEAAESLPPQQAEAPAQKPKDRKAG